MQKGSKTKRLRHTLVLDITFDVPVTEKYATQHFNLNAESADFNKYAHRASVVKLHRAKGWRRVIAYYMRNK